ncbi:MAG: RIP metalloprotease RseP, partial [Bacteroidaceae bacterium]|nr:RIP metalloprotease RseP [Bacteroidaceae bacterium]
FHIISTKDKWLRRLFNRPILQKDEGGQEPFTGTEYGIGWIPLGGYVKIAGMIDESMDTEQMAQPEQPWEFRAKPAWQRLLIMIGGVLVNFILALFIYSMVLYTWGDSYVPVQSYSEGMSFNERAKEIGFRDGDVLWATEQGEITARKTADVFRTIADAETVIVKRDGKEVSIAMPEDLSLLDMVNEVPQFMEMQIPNVVDSVIPGMPGAEAGLKAGDKLLAFNGQPIANYNQFMNEVARISDQTLEATPADSLRLRQLHLVVERAGACDTLHILMTPAFKIGFMAKMPEYESVQLEYGFFESFPAGIAYGWNVLSGYVGDLKYVFTKQGAKSVGGFGTIGSIFPATWDWHAFWMMTALLSIILAFMNILPIPALDGGHVLFLLWEVITGRKPSDKFMEYAQMVGMGLLLLLMVWANMNDVIRFLF